VHIQRDTPNDDIVHARAIQLRDDLQRAIERIHPGNLALPAERRLDSVHLEANENWKGGDRSTSVRSIEAVAEAVAIAQN
jgi:hypothetical protein